MFTIKETSWLEDFSETQQSIMEEAFLLDALALYAVSNGSFMRGERGNIFLWFSNGSAIIYPSTRLNCITCGSGWVVSPDCQGLLQAGS